MVCCFCVRDTNVAVELSDRCDDELGEWLSGWLLTGWYEISTEYELDCWISGWPLQHKIKIKINIILSITSYKFIECKYIHQPSVMHDVQMQIPASK